MTLSLLVNHHENAGPRVTAKLVRVLGPGILLAQGNDVGELRAPAADSPSERAERT